MKIGPYDTHPAADAFPMLEGPDFVALLEDVRRNGLRDPIVLDMQERIVDGRNRAKVLLELDRFKVPHTEGVVEIKTFDSESDVVDFVISRNLHRRHLTPSQRALIADKLATIAQGKKADGDALTQRQAADLLRVSERSVRAARELRESGRADLVEKVERGEKTLNRAVRESKRDASAAALRSKPTPPPDGPFDVVALDPPWRYTKNAAMSDDEDRRGEVDYPDMSDEEIVALDVPRLLAPSAVVLLWFTNAHAPVAVDCCRAWGLTWKTIVTWDKGRIGAGDVARGQTEHFAILTRGTPTLYTFPSTILKAPRREHSRKPEEFYALVEKHCPGTKLEMFARERRQGWTSHGVDVDKFPSAPVQRTLDMEAT